MLSQNSSSSFENSVACVSYVSPTGFQSIGGHGKLGARTRSAYFGFTDEALYLPVASEMPLEGHGVRILRVK